MLKTATDKSREEKSATYKIVAKNLWRVNTAKGKIYDKQTELAKAVTGKI